MSLKKKFSIKAKLLSAIIPITSAMIIVLVVIAYNVSASMIKRNAEELLETSVDKQSSNIESWMTENLNSFNSAKKAIEADRQNEKSLQKTVDSYYDFLKTEFTSQIKMVRSSKPKSRTKPSAIL